MKELLTIPLIMFLLSSALGQDTLTVEECYAWANDQYPLIAQRELLERTRSLTLENAAAARFPRIAFGGQATYQSDVTRIPFEMPGVEPLSKDQYRVQGEVSQALYTGGVVRQQVRMEDMSAATASAELEVQLYALRERIDDLYFGILLLRAQQGQSRLAREDLAAALRKVEAGVRYGTALASAADQLRAEQLRMDQRLIELESAEAAYLETLGQFINRNVTRSTILLRPNWAVPEPSLHRPELRLFDVRREGIDASRALLSARNRPRIELFVQGGYGRPALNMLDNAFDFYYVGGIRMNWMLTGLYTIRREKEVLDLRRRSLDVQEETFRFNTDLSRRQHEAGMEKLRRLMEADTAIVALRERVRKTAAAQLEEGVISANDYIREVHAADEARQEREVHEIQWLMALARYRFTTGQ